MTFLRNTADFLQRANTDASYLKIGSDLASKGSEADFYHYINNSKGAVSQPVLQVCILLHLLHLTADNRAEVRRSK